ncbi:MAG: enoyl-CoA hydratase/isomerase family protein, partial [Planctomycetota bacterium]
MIRVQDDAHVRIITIDRPEKRNALSVAMLEDLQRAFACADGVRAGVLLGSGS